MDVFAIIGWLIGGALAGTTVGLIVKRKKEGFGRFLNLAIGLAGGVIGGVIFESFNLTHMLKEFRVSARDIIGAIAGSLVLLGLVGLVAIVRRFTRKKNTDA